MNPGQQGAEQMVSIDLTTIKADLERGAIKLVFLQKDHFQFIQRRFDPATGTPIVPNVVPMNAAGVEATRKAIQEQIAKANDSLAGLDDLVAEMQRVEAAEK